MSAPAREIPLPVTRDVAARGARIRFADGGAGRPLLLVHDFLESRASWASTLPLLTARFRVLAPDLPGFGESEKPAASRFPYDAASFADALVELLAAVGESRVAVCGHGLGGAVALMMAARHPEMVERLVLVAPHVTPPTRDRATMLATAPLVGPFFYKQIYGRFLFRRHFQRKVRGAPPAALGARVDRLFDHFDTPAGREAAYATMVAMHDTRALEACLPRVDCPTLVACGRDDAYFPVPLARQLARALPHGRLETFDCGPRPADECPDAFARATAAFLAPSRARPTNKART